MTGRLVQADDENEEAALGAAMLRADACAAVVDSLSLADFRGELTGQVFAAIASLTHAGQRADEVAVKTELQHSGKLDSETALYIAELSEKVPVPENFAFYIKGVRESAYRRHMAELGSQLTAAASNGQDPASLANLAAQIADTAEEQAVQGFAPGAFDVITAREILELPDPPGEDELLGPLIVRRQRIVIGSHTGHGKTTLGLQIVRAVVRKGEFLGWYGTGGRALVIDAEQGLRTVKRRLREAGLDGDDVDVLRVPDGLTLDRDERERRRLEAVLETGYDVVFADPHYKLHGGDSNAERETVDLMKIFDRWREAYGFTLVLAVHCRKPPPASKFTMHEFFGSSALTRGAEVALGLQVLSRGYSKLHFFKDRDGDLPAGEAWGLLFDRDEGFRRDPNDGEKRKTAVERVRELLEARPELSQDEIAAETGYAKRTIHNALKELRAVETTAGGRIGQTKLWTLPEAVDP